MCITYKCVYFIYGQIFNTVNVCTLHYMGKINEIYVQ